VVFLSFLTNVGSIGHDLPLNFNLRIMHDRLPATPDAK
jgi:hypothetical protein